MTTTSAVLGEQRVIALSAIQVEAKFNPRDGAEQAKIDRLADSMRRHGPLMPLIVTANGDEGFRLIAGERRYHAARQAELEQVPVIVREANDNSGGLALAMVENIEREDLTPVEEARGFSRLMDEDGLTRKGVAETLSIPQRRVTERPPRVATSPLWTSSAPARRAGTLTSKAAQANPRPSQQSRARVARPTTTVHQPTRAR